MRNNVERSRYELTVDGELAGVADYSILDGSVLMPHTEVESRRRGQGLAAILVRAALDDLRSSGRSVIPQCWYVAQFIEQHPEYGDLVAS